MSDDNVHETTAKTVCGWARLTHPSGLLITLPVPVHGERFDYAGALASVNAALAAGWLAAAPGLEVGEEKEEIGYVLRRTKTNNDRSTSPIIDLYSTNDMVKHKVMSVYLDRPEDVSAFEHASGMQLAGLSDFPGTSAPKRGAGPSSDRFIIKVPRPFTVVLIPNPKWNAEEAAAVAARGKGEVYGVPKRKFVRWATGDGKPASAQAGGAESREQGTRTQADGDEFRYLLAGLQQARDLGALGAALAEVNKAATANRLTGTQRARLIEAKENRKRELADAPTKATAEEEEDPIPF